MFILEALGLIVNTFAMILNSLLSLIPIYKEFSGLQNQIFAHILGVPVFIISIIGLIYLLYKLYKVLRKIFGYE